MKGDIPRRQLVPLRAPSGDIIWPLRAATIRGADMDDAGIRERDCVQAGSGVNHPCLCVTLGRAALEGALPRPMQLRASGSSLSTALSSR